MLSMYKDHLLTTACYYRVFMWFSRLRTAYDECYQCALISSSHGRRHCVTSSQHPVDYGTERRPTSTPIVWTSREGLRAASSRTCRASAVLQAILGELRTVTGRLRADDERSELAGEWKHAAMVIDRCCQWTFTAFTVILTLSILCSAPHLFVL